GRKLGAQWPCGGAHRGRRRAHAVHRGDPRRRFPAARAEHAAPLGNRHPQRLRLVRLFQHRRPQGRHMTSGPGRATLFLDGVAGVRREIVTPEGVAMPVELANIGERGSAFAIDLFLWLGVTIFLYLMLALSLLQGIGGNVARTVILFIAFVVRNLYFVYFELAWQGATPGKRIIGLRVIDRRGGPLLPGAVIARNLPREIEAFLPLSLLLSLDPAHATAETWEMLTLGLWLLLFSALPFCNRDRMRGGDLIAGTMVISLPRRILLQDLAAAEPRRQVFTE